MSRRKAPLRMLMASAAIAFIAAADQPSHASSSDAWEEFRAEVAEACRKAADGVFRTLDVTVDPFGSESYGLAAVTGLVEGEKNPHVVICVFDKQSRKVEVGQPLAM